MLNVQEDIFGPREFGLRRCFDPGVHGGFELRLAECDDPTLAAALEPRLDLDAKGRIDDMLRRRDQRAQQ